MIIPTVVGGSRLERLLESLGSSGEFEVIVVDNGSPNGDVKELAAAAGAETIEFEENRGFGAAVNVAVREAAGEVIVLVNDDCVCEPGFVERLAAPVDPRGGVVMAAGVMRDARDPDRIDTAGIELDHTLLAADYLHGAPVASLADRPPPPFGPAGTAAALDRHAFLEVGGFDERLFMYLEDVDLAMRLRLAGATCALALDAIGMHAHSSTLGAGSARKNYLAGHSRGYLLRKWAVLDRSRVAAILLREGAVCAAQATVDRNLAGARGRVRGFLATPGAATAYPAVLTASFREDSSTSVLRRGARRFTRRRSGGIGHLEGGLASSLPASLAVGRGSALFVEGRCSSPTPVRTLEVTVDGGRHPVMAHRMAGPAGSRSPWDRWWAIVPFARTEQPHDASIGMVASLADGREVAADLGCLRLEPGPGPGRDLASGRRGAAPLIAICMATFEPPIDLFRRQIETIRAQTYPNWACVISDDASGPEALAGIRGVLGDDPRFRLEANTERFGFYGNYERALLLTPPDAAYVALADQDDAWDRDKLETLAAAIGDARLAYSDMRIVDGEGALLSDTFWRYRRNNSTDLSMLLMGNTVTGAASLIPRDLLDVALPFPPRLGNAFHDHWIATVALATGRIRYVDRALYDYVQHPAAKLGFSRANAGRGQVASPLLELASRARRILSRLADPMGKTRYFDDYCRVALTSQVLLERCSDAMTPEDIGALRRVLAADRSLRDLGALVVGALRSMRSGNPTMGVDRSVLVGLAWRRWTARRRSYS